MRNKLWIFFLFFGIVAGNAVAQNWTLKTREQLLDSAYSTTIFRYTYDEYAKIAMDSKEYYYKANEYRDKKDYTNALKNYEIALSMFDWGAFYYQYGYCLMDMGQYEDAEKAFKKAIKAIPRYDPYTIIAPGRAEWGKNSLYSFDNNGIVRELYFSYYNIACIYSLQKKLNESLEYIKLAIESGYPYLNNIMADTDLANLFNSSNSATIKTEINKSYLAGTENRVRGRTIEYGAASESRKWVFVDGNDVRKILVTSLDRDHILYGTYQVKNYHVIIKYNRETGRKGHNPLRGGETFEYYVSYDKTINETEYMSLKEISEDDAYDYKMDK
jgi:tetratricopeptide (TPR) repeat protein